MNQEMLVRHGLLPILPAAFDHQVTGTFGECERMAYYKDILGRRNIRQDSFNLVWGLVFHGATEIWVETGDTQQVIDYISEGIPETTEDRYGRDRSRMFELVGEWAKYNTANPLKVLYTEQAVMIRCVGPCPYYDTGCNLEYGGRMDRIVEWQQLIGPLDYKTTTMDESDPITKYRPNHQTMGYVWAASHLTGSHCWGIIVERAVCNKSKMRLDRFPVPFSRDNIRDWVENEKVMQARIRDRFEHHRFDESAWQQNYARCAEPYPCHYRDVCLSPREGGFRYRWLRDNTVEYRWDFTDPKR